MPRLSTNTPLPEIGWTLLLPLVRHKILTSALRVWVLSTSGSSGGAEGGSDVCGVVVFFCATVVPAAGKVFCGVEVPMTDREEDGVDVVGVARGGRIVITVSCGMRAPIKDCAVIRRVAPSDASV